jgi:hypothetical protein
MTRLNRDRLKKFEARLGFALPADFVATLEQHEPVDEGDVAIVTPQRVWDVRTTFGLDDLGAPTINSTSCTTSSVTCFLPGRCRSPPTGPTTSIV